ncbi:MAG: hypothetical protein U1E78_07845 [Gammaproteobacteria bacterium]
MKRETVLKISFKMFYRELNSTPVILWMISLFCAACICTTLIGMVETLKSNLSRNTAELAGGDLIISSDRPLPDIFLKTADNLKIESSESIRFFSMIESKNEFRLASVRAVDSFYPLYGQLEIESNDERLKEGGPRQGEIWVSNRLAIELEIKAQDQIKIGRALFRVGAILKKEPDSAGGSQLFAPRVLMHLKDVPQTAVVQPGSRIGYALQLKAGSGTLMAYQSQIQGALDASVRLSKPEDTNMAFKTFWRNTESLTSIAVLSTLLLTGLAVLMATRNYVLNHRQHVLLLKTLGITGKGVGKIFLLSFSWITLTGLLLGAIVGYVILIFLNAKLTALPLLLSFLLGLGVVFTFGFPMINRLRNLEPIAIIQQTSNLELSVDLAPIVGLFFGLIMILYFVQGQINLLAIVGLSLLYAGFLICGLYYVILKLLRKISTNLRGVWRFAIRNMVARASDGVLQMLVFTFIFFMIGLNYGLLQSALDKWIAELPPDTPNYFVVNVAPDNIPLFKEKLSENNIKPREIYSIVRGRLTHINNKPSNKIQRFLNLTSMRAIPKDNKLLLGPSWIEHPANAVSVEANIANRLNLKLGDKLKFIIEDEIVEAYVFNIRNVIWGSLKPNFYFIFDEAQLNHFASTAMTSFHLAENEKHLIPILINSFPEISVIDIDDTLESIADLMAQLKRGLMALLGAMCMIGVIAWIGSLWLTLKEREREQALLSALGANYGSLLKINLLEFGFSGIIVGLLSLGLSTAVCHYIATHFLAIAYEIFSLTTVVLFGVVVMVFLGVGILFTRIIQSISPMMLLNKVSHSR